MKSRNFSLNGFSVAVSADSVRNINKGEHDYVGLKHKSEYTIELTNDNSTRCDATVYVDGNSAGTFRINPYSTIKISRPSSVNRSFTFLKEQSSDAHHAGIKSHNDNGLIKVVFTPEKNGGVDPMSFYGDDIPQYNFTDGFNNGQQYRCKGVNTYSSSLKNHTFESATFGRMSSGATALGRENRQRFNTVSKLENIDESKITTLHLRLVVDDTNEYPYTAWRAFPTNSNKVPPKPNDDPWYSGKTMWYDSWRPASLWD